MAPEGIGWLASVTGFALAMSASPGPNNTMVAASAANFGLWRTVPHILGVALGFPAMLVLVSLGAAEVLRASPALEQGLRWVGAAWLLWIAWRIATAAPAAPGAEGTGRASRPMGVLEAALFQWVNPKAWLIAAGAIAAYTGSPAGLAAEAGLLAGIFALAAAASLVGWAAIGAGAARLLVRPGAMRAFNRAMAALLVLSLVMVL
jgi:threonine/homoserine/homoserine lactone efflux protein